MPALATICVGAVGPWERAAVHASLAVVAVRLGGRDVEADLRRRWWRAAAWIAAPAVLSLIPMPSAVVASVAPGVAAAAERGAWGPLSLSPEATARWLLGLTLVAGWGALALAGARTARDPERVEADVARAGLVYAVVGALHVGMGWRALFGLIPVRPVEDLYLAPLINPNHAGLVVWIAAPFWLVRLRHTRTPGWERALCTVAIGWAVVLPVLTASMGLVAAASALLVFGLLRSGLSAVNKGLGVGLLGAAGAAAAWTVVERQEAWWVLSGRPRLAQWTDTVALLRDQLWTGFGPGAYAVGYPAYRTLPTFASFEHAHADPLEWLAETGLIGLACACAAVAWGPRPAAGAGRWPWAAALVGLGAHALVDFPLQIPAIALIGAGLLAGWLGLSGPDATDAARTPVVGRRWLAAGVQLAIAALFLGFGWVDRRAAAVVASPDPATAAALRRQAPWRWEGWAAGVLAVRAEDGPDSVRAALALARPRLGPEATPLRLVGWHLLSVGRPAEAVALLDDAIRRDPNDWRSWYLRARARHAAGDLAGGIEDLGRAMRHWPAAEAQREDLVAVAWSWRPDGLYWIDALADAPPHVSMKLAWLLQREGRAEMALLAADQAALLRPEAHRFNPTRVAALVALDEIPLAIADVELWMKVRPDDPWAWISAAVVAGPAERPDWRAGVIVAGLLALDQPAVLRRLQAAARVGPEDLRPLAARAAAIDELRGRGEVSACEAETMAIASILGVADRIGARRWSCRAPVAGRGRHPSP